MLAQRQDLEESHQVETIHAGSCAMHMLPNFGQEAAIRVKEINTLGLAELSRVHNFGGP